MHVRLTRIVRDPLFVFCLLGAGCFLLFAALTDEREVIVLSDSLRANLADDFTLLHGRPPSAEDIDELTNRYVADEIMFREALARSLHLNDARVRMMMIEKMRFLLADEPAEPSDEAVVAHYADNLERYTSEPRYTLRNIFFRQRPGEPETILKALRNGAEIDGDPGFWLGAEIVDYHASVLANVLGPEALATLEAMQPGEWRGPIASPRGYHFLRLDEMVPRRPLRFAEISDQVREDWSNAQRRASIARRLDGLRDGYAIRER